MGMRIGSARRRVLVVHAGCRLGGRGVSTTVGVVGRRVERLSVGMGMGLRSVSNHWVRLIVSVLRVRMGGRSSCVVHGVVRHGR